MIGGDGNNLLAGPGAIGTPIDPVNTEQQIPVNSPNSNIGQNTEAAAKAGGSIIWWVILFGVYLFWDYIQTREKVSDAVKPRNVRANIHNMAVIGFATIIFINGGNVLLTKLAAMRIPGISKGAACLLPLFHL